MRYNNIVAIIALLISGQCFAVPSVVFAKTSPPDDPPGGLMYVAPYQAAGIGTYMGGGLICFGGTRVEGYYTYITPAGQQLTACTFSDGWSAFIEDVNQTAGWMWAVFQNIARTQLPERTYSESDYAIYVTNVQPIAQRVGYPYPYTNYSADVSLVYRPTAVDKKRPRQNPKIKTEGACNAPEIDLRVGDPIDVISGAMDYFVNDIYSGSVSLGRYYYSNPINLPSSSTQSGLMPVGWQLDYSQQLQPYLDTAYVVLSNGSFQQKPTYGVGLNRTGGGVIKFGVLSGDGQYNSLPKSDFGMLLVSGGGRYAKLPYENRWESFDANGSLTSVKLAGGGIQNVVRNGNTTQIQDQFGRGLTITNRNDGLPSSVVGGGWPDSYVFIYKWGYATWQSTFGGDVFFGWANQSEYLLLCAIH